jgi:hypothetical protein
MLCFKYVTNSWPLDSAVIVKLQSADPRPAESGIRASKAEVHDEYCVTFLSSVPDRPRHFAAVEGVV